MSKPKVYYFEGQMPPPPVKLSDPRSSLSMSLLDRTPGFVRKRVAHYLWRKVQWDRDQILSAGTGLAPVSTNYHFNKGLLDKLLRQLNDPELRGLVTRAAGGLEKDFQKPHPSVNANESIIGLYEMLAREQRPELFRAWDRAMDDLAPREAGPNPRYRTDLGHTRH
jgi:hypothetical protein